MVDFISRIVIRGSAVGGSVGESSDSCSQMWAVAVSCIAKFLNNIVK